MKKTGRKARIKGKQSTKFIGFKVTPEEHAIFLQQAETAGLSLSDLIRSKMTGGRIQAKPFIPEMNREAFAALARTAANINQLTRHLNEGRITGRAVYLDVAIIRNEFALMNQKIQDLRRLLLVGDYDRENH